ncbi:MAG: HAD family phosphatase [Erysipelotrichaceae bacterium]|nr:HAD family phosphatase [Erysipelotrichaceae bacterium]
MNYKEEIMAIVFDFDGTLIDFSYQASDFTRKALELLKEKDYKICLASGRPCFLALKAFYDVFGDYPLDYISGCNGTEFMDISKNETVFIYSLSKEDIIAIGKQFESTEYLTLGIYEEECFLVNRMPENPVILEWMNARWLKPVLYDYSGNDKERSKVIVLNDPKDREKEEILVKDLDLNRYNHAFSSPYCYEITPKGVDKAAGIRYLAEILNCETRQILSFGDMENDMPMLLNSTGVIMDNAAEKLKEMIPLHTGSVEKEGIYTFLSQNHLI